MGEWKTYHDCAIASFSFFFFNLLTILILLKALLPTSRFQCFLAPLYLMLAFVFPLLRHDCFPLITLKEGPP